MSDPYVVSVIGRLLNWCSQSHNTFKFYLFQAVMVQAMRQRSQGEEKH